MPSLLHDLLAGREISDLLIFLTTTQDEARMRQLFALFYSHLGGRFISLEGKISPSIIGSGITFIDSLFFLCHCEYNGKLDKLYAFLDQSKPIFAMLSADLLEHLAPPIVDHLNRTASWLSFDDASDCLRLRVLKRSGKFVEQFYAVPHGQLSPDTLRLLDKQPLKEQQVYGDLSFTVELSARQKEAKDSLHLPYWEAQQTAGHEPVISYFHDKMDDIDEDDPDADLEF